MILEMLDELEQKDSIFAQEDTTADNVDVEQDLEDDEEDEEDWDDEDDYEDEEDEDEELD